MGKTSKHANGRATSFLADLVIRIIYFVATALIMFLAVLKLSNRHDIEITQWHYLVIFGSALFFAIFGPYLQRLESQRARRNLDDAKRQSERDQE